MAFSIHDNPRWFWISPLVLLLVTHLMLPLDAVAEGTYELMDRSNANDQVYLESSEPGDTASTDLGFPRITYFKVDIVTSDEVIDFYTSDFDNDTPDSTPLDIAVWCPGNSPYDPVDYSGYDSDYITADWTFDVSGPGGSGYLDNWSDLLAAQDISTRFAPGTPVPATYTPACGLGTYTVRLYGGNVSVTDAVEFFDVMVRDTNGTAGNTTDDSLERGRVWADHLALIMDGFGPELVTNYYIVAGSDQGTRYNGVVWYGQANGIRPFGFHMYANPFGAAPEEHYSQSVLNSAVPTPQIVPGYPFYLNPPQKPVDLPPSPTIEGFNFTPLCPGPSGGVFAFTTNGEWQYTISIDRNGNGTYEPDEAILIGTTSSGMETTVAWDGTYADGTPVPAGTMAAIEIANQSGEVHFPYYDVENQNTVAGPIILPYNATTTDYPSTAYYYWDDLNLSNGTASPAGGSLTPHQWGDAGNASGNDAIIDTWKFLESTRQEIIFIYSELICPGDLYGLVFEDQNGNGTNDPGEPGIAGVDVLVTDFIGGERTVTTAANGIYTANVPAGVATLTIDRTTLPIGYVQTAGVDPSDVTVVTDASVDAGIDGYQIQAAAGSYSVPTLSQWGQIIFFALLGIIAVRQIRRPGLPH